MGRPSRDPSLVGRNEVEFQRRKGPGLPSNPQHLMRLLPVHPSVSCCPEALWSRSRRWVANTEWHFAIGGCPMRGYRAVVRDHRIQVNRDALGLMSDFASLIGSLLRMERSACSETGFGK